MLLLLLLLCCGEELQLYSHCAAAAEAPGRSRGPLNQAPSASMQAKGLAAGTTAHFISSTAQRSSEQEPKSESQLSALVSGPTEEQLLHEPHAPALHAELSVRLTR